MTIVDTRAGKVEGFERDGIHQFRGIPYAAPPVGPLRWRPPVREEPWSGVRDATRFSAESAQGPFPLAQMMGGTPPERSEDSLTLNVYTPGTDEPRRPVLVWIHGGAFMNGSASTPWYDGTRFAQHGDVVVVTLNYRLGPFGFLHLADLVGPELAGSGNAGILDQIAALEWVRDCIGAFGGDPDQVMVFGESAGAGSVGTLLGTPRARGLFTAAVPQSGAASWAVSSDDATAVAELVCAALGVKPGDLDALYATTTDQLVDTVQQYRSWVANRPRMPFAPVVDGVVLPAPPLDAIRAGSAAGVRLLTGTNTDEMTLFHLADPGYATIDEAELRRRVGEWLPFADPDAVVAGYRAALPDATAPLLWSAISTDAVFRIPAIRLAEAQSAHAPTWMYLFSWPSTAFGGALRSTHALEIPFVWDNLHKRGSEMFTGPGEERQAIADAMHRAWLAFASTGTPDHPGIPTWPTYEPTRRATMGFDETIEVLDDPSGDTRALWDTHAPDA
ncbi:MAG TPA: carboxylesterase/lipase family protein [Acidimicrobiia bacterium]|nr:carboxylesterase/lipase family protein [Acidimicrobiia bacterium]